MSVRGGERIGLLGLAAALSLCGPGRLDAQHALAAGEVVGSQASDCSFCHSEHGKASGSSNLRLDASAMKIGSAGTSSVSESCLRCHTSRSVRMRQQEFTAAGPLDRGNAGYLSDVGGDHHPFGQSMTGSMEFDLSEPSDWAAEGYAGEQAFQNAAEAKCTSCHDPHDQAASTLSIESERTVCTECHVGNELSFGVHRFVPCSGCHKLHGAFDRRLLAQDYADAVCIGCHEGQGGLTPALHEADDRQLRVQSSVAPPPAVHMVAVSGSCIGCHTHH